MLIFNIKNCEFNALHSMVLIYSFLIWSDCKVRSIDHVETISSLISLVSLIECQNAVYHNKNSF